MRKAVSVFWLLAALAPIAFAHSIPASVASFYDDWNFVAMNSRLEERASIWEKYSKGESLPSTFLSTLPAHEILRRLIRIRRVLIRTDNPMVLETELTQLVASELLIPEPANDLRAQELIVIVRVLNLPEHDARSIHDSNWPTVVDFTVMYEYPIMCRYTDRWINTGESWLLIRSDFIPVNLSALRS